MAEGYVAGACNIGPAEVGRRRRTGHLGAALTVVLLVFLGAFRAPRGWRLLAILPAGLSAAGYLQARHHFCANFGWRGVFNFGALGPVERVGDAAARVADRRQAVRIALESGGIGLAVALLALLPRCGR